MKANVAVNFSKEERRIYKKENLSSIEQAIYAINSLKFAIEAMKKLKTFDGSNIKVIGAWID